MSECGRATPGERLLVLACPSTVSEAKTDQHGHDAGQAERCNRNTKGRWSQRAMVAIGL
jgi:hypothetical protein